MSAPDDVASKCALENSSILMESSEVRRQVTWVQRGDDQLLYPSTKVISIHAENFGFKILIIVGDISETMFHVN